MSPKKTVSGPSPDSFRQRLKGVTAQLQGLKGQFHLTDNKAHIAMQALVLAHKTKHELPKWALNHLVGAIAIYMDGQAATIDAAMGITANKKDATRQNRVEKQEKRNTTIPKNSHQQEKTKTPYPGSRRTKTKHIGIYTRTSARRTYRGRPDVCFDITYKNKKKLIWEKIGWLSEGYNARTAMKIRGERIRYQRHGDILHTKETGNKTRTRASHKTSTKKQDNRARKTPEALGWPRVK